MFQPTSIGVRKRSSPPCLREFMGIQLQASEKKNNTETGNKKSTKIYLVGAQPSPCCLFARRLVGKMVALPSLICSSLSTAQIYPRRIL